jgi:DNA-binding XRE family transcriptional regulator
MPDRPLVWLHGEIRTPPFSKEARVGAGYALRQLQQGLSLGLPHSRPMPAMGRRCRPGRGKTEPVRKAKRTRLERAGWKLGSTQDFLGLSDEEAAFIELKLSLAQSLRKERQKQGLTQMQLAKRLDSSQSRVAKMEAGDRSVSLDLLVRSLLAIGTTKRQLARIISPERRSAA